MKRIALILATGFGLGYAPVASGTAGALPGILLAWLLYPLSIGWQMGVALVLSLLALPICEVAERHFVRKDDGRIVADEYLTFPICLIGIPWVEHVWFLGIAFVVSRIMDIIKPFPARRLQDLHGGLGITVDDVIANIYALGVNWGIWLVMGKVLGFIRS
jgi:phosphatidylglycerophosphatase A